MTEKSEFRYVVTQSTSHMLCEVRKQFKVLKDSHSILLGE